MRKYYLLSLVLSCLALSPSVQGHTVLNNTVVFVRFADETETGPGAVFQTNTIEHYDSLFNSSIISRRHPTANLPGEAVFSLPLPAAR